MRRFLLPFVVFVPAVFVLACSSGDATSAAPSSSGSGGATSATSSGGAGGMPDAGPIGGDRPVQVIVPPAYVHGTPTPLVILLHGYSASGALEDLYLGFSALAAQRGFLYAHPDGLVDSLGNHFWNATDACCDFDGNPVDDSAYLSGVVDQIKAAYTVDPKRVYFVGHSNGAFMAYRMACDHADQIAAIVSLAGAMNSDVSKCNPVEPVSILEIHGTADTVIAYLGGTIGTATFPGATTSVADWVTLDDCSATPDTSSPPLDLDVTLPGDETTVTKYASGCKPGGHAELWTIVGGSHIPTISPQFSPDIIDFLYAHPKP